MSHSDRPAKQCLYLSYASLAVFKELESDQVRAWLNFPLTSSHVNVSAEPLSASAWSLPAIGCPSG
jgi:hypothetical protein